MTPEPINLSNLTNHFLIAMPGLEDSSFAGAVIYLCEHNDNGALGLVINKPIDITLKSLFAKIDLTLTRAEMSEMPVYYGGPVQAERGFVLHERLSDEPTGYSSTLSIPGGLEVTTSKDVLEALSSGAGPRRVLVTLGYSGWEAGQLEQEIGRNGWLTVQAQPGIIFDTPVEQRYEKVFTLLGFDPAQLSSVSGHA